VLGKGSLLLDVCPLDFGLCCRLFRTVAERRLDIRRARRFDIRDIRQRSRRDVLVGRKLKKLDEPLLCDLVRGLGIDNPLALGLEDGN
jgi:hypothetical protein